MKWLKYSGVWAGLVLNPYHWRPDFKFFKKQEHEEFGVGYLEINIGFFWLRIIIDDGRW